MTKKLWAGRFAKQTHAEVEKYTASIEFDNELAYEDILGSLGHIAMLAHCEIITSNEKEQLQAGLQQIANNIAQGGVNFRIEDEDIHMNIERLLGEIVGNVAGKLHTARSRNDQVALDMHLYLRKQIVVIAELLRELQETLFNLASQHKSVILPGYTHSQRAQPIYLAQYWLAYISMFQRDIERLITFWPHINRSPLGACALTGTTFPIDRHYVSDLLGFDGIYINKLDAISNRDFIIEFLSHASLIMMHISRLSEELILWSTQEFNFIYFDDAYSTGSSIMPQKKNPDVAELGRGKVGRTYGNLFTLLTILKGLPLAYNKDLQEDKEPLFDTIKTVKQTLSIYSPLLANIKINTDAMYKATQQGYLNATALAEYLVKKGLTFRTSHEIVGKMVAFSIDKNCQLEQLTLPEMQQFSKLIEQDVYHILSIENAVAACDENHYSMSSSLEDEFKNHSQHIEENKIWVTGKRQLLIKLYENFQVPFYCD